MCCFLKSDQNLSLNLIVQEKKNKLTYFNKTVLQSCKTGSTEPKISSVVREPNKVCGQATVLKPCQ